MPCHAPVSVATHTLPPTCVARQASLDDDERKRLAIVKEEELELLEIEKALKKARREEVQKVVALERARTVAPTPALEGAKMTPMQRWVAGSS